MASNGATYRRYRAGSRREEALDRGYEIVHPLTTETWGVRRFFVRAPDGNILNMVQHRD